MKISRDYLVLNILGFIILGLFAFNAFLPFYSMIIGSFSSESSIIRYGYVLFPREWSLDAYRAIFTNSRIIINSYAVTIFVTTVGTTSALFLSSMAAYALSRNDFKYRNQIAFYLFFTTLFHGGLLPTYLLISDTLKLKNTLLILILHGIFSVFNILVLRNFIKGSIPDSLGESAKIDGAGDFLIFIKIVLPLCKPALASIGLFIALAYWNDWATAMLYVSNARLFPLQYTLYQILSKANFLSSMDSNISGGDILPVIDMPAETMKLAMTVVVTGPIVFAYPFAQKYFVRGITIGAVKG